jgi:hypothetical protein
MASHAPDPTLTADLVSMLDGLGLEQEQGVDGPLSQHGVGYRTLRGVGKDPSMLMLWIKSILDDAKEAGATKIVYAEPPLMTRYENNRKFSKGIVMRFHVMPEAANEPLPPSSDSGPAKMIGPQS